MVNYEFRYVVKMTNGKEYEIITNFHGEKDVLKYIDTHDYIDLFDRKIEEMVAVKSEYVMSVLYKDSQKIDSEGNTDWTDREDYLKEENKQLKAERDVLIDDLSKYEARVSRLEQIREIKDNALKGADIKIKTLERENEQLKNEDLLK